MSDTPEQEPIPAADTPAPAPAAEPAVAAEAAPEDVAAVAAEATEAAAVAPEAAAPAAPAVPELGPAATGALLAQHFPALFGEGVWKPIKLRIQADIQQRVPGVFTKKSLSVFLHRHTTSTPYLKALVAAPQRYDLDGAEAGEVATEHRDAAGVELERRRAIVMAKRQAERAAQRPPRGPRPQAAAPEGGAAPAPADRPPRTDRPPRPDRPPRGERPPRADGAPPRREGRPPQGRPGPRGDQPPRPQAQGRPDRPDRHERPPRPDQRADPRPPRPPREERPAPEFAVDPSLSPAEQAARRERALLLRAWETTTLTRSNFCVLKRISEADLEAALAQAQQERGPRARPEPRPAR